MIYDSPIVRVSFSSAALHYALVCAEAALSLCVKGQDPRED